MSLPLQRYGATSLGSQPARQVQVVRTCRRTVTRYGDSIVIAFVGLVSRFLALVFFFFCLVVYTSTSQTQSLYSIRSTETDRQTTLYRRPDTDQLWSQSTAGSYRLQGIDRIHVQGGWIITWYYVQRCGYPPEPIIYPLRQDRQAVQQVERKCFSTNSLFRFWNWEMYGGVRSKQRRQTTPYRVTDYR